MEKIEFDDTFGKDNKTQKLYTRSRKTQAWRDEQGGNENDIIQVKGVDGHVTRNLLKTTKSIKRKRNFFDAGTLVWGSCTGWWPGKRRKKIIFSFQNFMFYMVKI